MNTTPEFFSSQSDWHEWLEYNHDKATEKWIGFYKTKSKIKGITYKEALDEALCYGWIDAVRKTIDDNRWTIRFTPRKKESIWSKVNIIRIEELIVEGRVQPSGLKVYNERDGKKSKMYSFEQETIELPLEYEN